MVIARATATRMLSARPSRLDTRPDCPLCGRGVESGNGVPPIVVLARCGSSEQLFLGVEAVNSSPVDLGASGLVSARTRPSMVGGKDSPPTVFVKESLSAVVGN
jgi:hypothetical protein